MATKAESFRYWTERAGPKKEKAPPKRHDEAAAASPGARKESLRAGKKAGYALEDSAGRPSRKSTRKASNRQRNDTQMRVKARTAEVRPSSRPAPTI